MAHPVVHFEFIARDVEQMQEFYRQMFGWQFDHVPGPVPYSTITTGAEAPVSGGLGASRPDYPGHLTIYVRVDDVESALATAELHGGTRVIGPEQVPGGPVMGRFRDPEGNLVSVQSG